MITVWIAGVVKYGVVYCGLALDGVVLCFVSGGVFVVRWSLREAGSRGWWGAALGTLAFAWDGWIWCDGVDWCGAGWACWVVVESVETVG